MGRALALTVGLAFSLMTARQAAAIAITAVDLDAVSLGSPVGDAVLDEFTSRIGASATVGTLETKVFFDGVNYIYTLTVNPNGDLNATLDLNATIGQPRGFTGLMGWRFADAASAGGNGDASDFFVFINLNPTGPVTWLANRIYGQWNAFEPITFFFASTNPPTIGDYSLFRNQPLGLGEAQGLAPETPPTPVPEPGTIALFGSGLGALYASLRRRRNLRKI